MKVLVTGGRGYVGTCVAQILTEQGHAVTILSRKPGAGVIAADLRNQEKVLEAVTKAKPDAIVHLAALTHGRDSFEQPLEYFDVNLNGTLNLLHAASTLPQPIRFVFVSTNNVYGSRYEGALSETFDCFPESPYAVSKFAAERLVQAVAATGVISAVTLRIFNVAGAHGGKGDIDTTRIIPNALRAANGQLPHVTLNGDGSAMRDFIHIKDVASAIAAALTAEVDKQIGYECFNVGSGLGTSMSSIIDMVRRITGLEVPVVQAPQKPEPQRLIADISHITAATGWTPANSDLETIIRDAWEAWQKPI